MANKKRLIIGTSAVVTVAIIIALTVLQAGERERAASRAVSDVRLPVSVATAIPPSTAEELFKVAEEYKGTKAAARALLLGAGVLFSQNTQESYTEAHRRFEMLLQEYPESVWAAQAHLGIAASLVALGKTKEAIEKYEEIQLRLADSAVIEEAQLGLARLYEADAEKEEDAYKLYSKLAKELTGNIIGSEASLRKTLMAKANPELAKLDAPPDTSALPQTGAPQSEAMQQMMSNALKKAQAEAAQEAGAAQPRPTPQPDGVPQPKPVPTTEAPTTVPAPETTPPAATPPKE
jgi:tetratricopeptide (TPR) repeat protein